MPYANLPMRCPCKRSRIMTATMMFHTKWLLSCDVQCLTVDNDTAAGCVRAIAPFKNAMEATFS